MASKKPKKPWAFGELPQGDNIFYRPMSASEFTDFEKTGVINPSKYINPEAAGHVSGFTKPDLAIKVAGPGGKVVALNSAGTYKADGWESADAGGDIRKSYKQGPFQGKMLGNMDVSQEMWDETIVKHAGNNRGLGIISGASEGARMKEGDTVHKTSMSGKGTDAFEVWGQGTDPRAPVQFNGAKGGSRAAERFNHASVIAEGDVTAAKQRIQERQAVKAPKPKVEPPPMSSIVEDVHEKFQDQVLQARKRGLLPSSSADPKGYQEGIERIGDWTKKYADMNLHEIVYKDSHRAELGNAIDAAKHSEPEWLSGVEKTARPGTTPLESYQKGSGTFYGYDKEKGTVKANLYRGAQQGEKIDGVSYWTTNKSYAERFAKKAGDNGKLYQAEVELPVREIDGRLHVETNAPYMEGTNMTERFAKTGNADKVIATTTMSSQSHAGWTPITMGEEANDNLGTRHMILGKDYLDGNVTEVTKPKAEMPRSPLSAAEKMAQKVSDIKYKSTKEVLSSKEISFLGDKDLFEIYNDYSHVSDGMLNAGDENLAKTARENLKSTRQEILNRGYSFGEIKPGEIIDGKTMVSLGNIPNPGDKEQYSVHSNSRSLIYDSEGKLVQKGQVITYGEKPPLPEAPKPELPGGEAPLPEPPKPKIPGGEHSLPTPPKPEMPKPGGPSEEKLKQQAEAKRKAEQEAKRKAEAEAKRKAEEAKKREAARQIEEASKKQEAKRKADEAKRKAEAEAKRKAQAEAKAKQQAEQKAKEAAKQKAVEDAQRKAQEQAKKRQEAEAKKRAEKPRTPSPPPEDPTKPPLRINPKYTAGKIDNIETTEHMLKGGGGGGRWKVVAGIGAVAGLIKANADDTDDNLLSGTMKMAGGAGVALGVDWGVNKFMNRSSTAADISKADVEGVSLVNNAEPAPRKGVSLTSGDLEIEKMKVDHNLTQEEMARVKKIKGWGAKGKLAGLIGLGAFAAASAMDAGQDLSDKTEASNMKAEQERNLTKKQSRERKNQAQNAYGHVDMGQMAIDMFNDRIGHHLMGNAKAQMPVYNTTYQG